MPCFTSTHEVVKERFGLECARLQREARVATHDSALTLDFSRASWVVSEFEELVALSEGEPVRNLEPMVRRRLVDETVVQEGGDPVIDPYHQLQLDQEVQLIMRALDEARRSSGHHWE